MTSRTVLESRGGERQYDSPIVGVQASRDGATLAALTADGDIILLTRDTVKTPEAWQCVRVLEGALCLAQDCAPEGFLAGGEDGRVVRVLPTGEVQELTRQRGWIDCLASTPEHFAFSCKKAVYLHGQDASLLKTLEHSSSISGLVFDAKGRRLAVSHYNGASLWFVQAQQSTVRALTWKGSHISLAIHPTGEALVTSMQENELHGWRLSDGHNMRMSGYPRQVRSMSFTRNGRWLATSGADAAVLWPFFGGGPMGKAPRELARLLGLFTTCVCAHPREDILAIGFEDGTIVLAETGGEGERILPLCTGERSGGVARGAVSSLAFTPHGGTLVFGTEEGYCGAVDLSASSGS